MKAINHFKPARGFSLIEVLVAVVILSIGLLALASLQLNMIRASSTTKAQSIAASLAKERIERLRSFTSMAVYQGITAPVAGFVETINDSGGNLGGVDYRRTTRVFRYIYSKAGTGSFIQLTNAQNTLSDAAIQALDSNYLVGKDFKRIIVDVSWVDGTGVANQITLEDIIDGLDPSESGDLLSANANPAGPRKVEVKIHDPALDSLVIPTRIGVGTDIASTNPVPTVTMNAGADTVETRFDVLTYGSVNAGTATVQAKVETATAGCFCSMDSLPAAAVRGNKRPTYWNGFRYAVPLFVEATGTGTYSPKGKIDPAVTGQSEFCTICCRDHHDPVDVKGPTFSPRLVTKNASDVVTASTHDHYRATGPEPGTTYTGPQSPGTGVKYNESCRIIRVDGIWSVAADLQDDYYTLVATQELSDPKYYASGAAPDVNAFTSYQNMVTDYLETRLVDAGRNQSNYNNMVAASDITTMEATHSINTPTSIAIANTFTGTVSTKTISAITKANPGVVTSASHGFANDDRVTFAVNGMRQLNNKSYIIANVSANTFEIKGVDTTLYSTFTSGTASVNHGKWLHSRGLFVDYLEKDALAAIDAAKTNCPVQSGTGYTFCVLTVTPFQQNNLTELAKWTTSDGNKLLVTNNDYSGTTSELNPVRGKVTYKVGAADGNVTVTATSRRGNSSFLDLATAAISPVVDAATLSDAQAFTIGNATPPGPDITGQFYVGLSIPFKAGLAVNYIYDGGAPATCNFNVANSQYLCDVNLDKALWSNVLDKMAIEVKNYNFETTGSNVTVTGSVFPCTYAGTETGFPDKTYISGTSSPTTATYVEKTCNDYNVAAKARNSTLSEDSYDGTTTNPGKLSEVTRFLFPHVTADTDEADATFIDKLNVDLGSPTTATGTRACTYTCTQFDNNGSPGDCKSLAKTIFAFASKCN